MPQILRWSPEEDKTVAQRCMRHVSLQQSLGWEVREGRQLSLAWGEGADHLTVLRGSPAWGWSHQSRLDPVGWQSKRQPQLWGVIDFCHAGKINQYIASHNNDHFGSLLSEKNLKQQAELHSSSSLPQCPKSYLLLGESSQSNIKSLLCLHGVVSCIF